MKPKDLHKLIHKITFEKKHRRKIFLDLSPKKRAYVIMRLSRYIQSKLVSDIPDEKLVGILEILDPDEATDIMQLLSEERQKDITAKFNAKLRSSIEILNQFDPQTAAGLMNLDYIQVDINDTISEIARQFSVHEKRTGRPPVIIITEENQVKGYLPGYKLGIVKKSDKARKHLDKIYTIRHDASHEKVAEMFRRHRHSRVAVMGKGRNIIGIIYSDNILRLLEAKDRSSLYDFAGVSEEETVADGALRKIKSRYKWLIINMATAFLAAFTVSIFEDTITKYVLLAVYMPIVAGMGGNAGTQTLAVLVRGIALKQIELRTAMPALRSEVLAGLGNGLINGIIVATIVILVNHDLAIALILGLAMIINLFVASFFGTLIPLIMEKLGKDPATSATIFITTATDVLGFLAFLGIATAILN